MTAGTPPKPSPVSQGDPSPIVVRLTGIDRVIQVRGSFARMPLKPAGKMRIEMGPPATSASIVENNRLLVSVAHSFEARREKHGDSGTVLGGVPAGAVVARVTATFIVVYSFEPGEPFAEADLQAFAAANGAFNVMPFWREYLNSCLVRAELPPYMAPIMKFTGRPAPRSAAPHPVRKSPPRQ